MGIKLMVEVLDHYRGPDCKFRWLIAFAEKAEDKTRSGSPGRALMAHRIQRSESRASHIASELEADGVIKRVGDAGRGRGSAEYELLPLAIEQGAPRAHPMRPPKGAARAHPKSASKGAPRAHPISEHTDSFNPKDLPNPTGSGDASAPPTAQSILGAFIDWDREHGGQLTRRVTGQLAKHIKTLLDEGIDDRYIRTGLAEWRTKGMHPAALDSFVSAAMNGNTSSRRKKPSTGDQALIDAEQLKRELR